MADLICFHCVRREIFAAWVINCDTLVLIKIVTNCVSICRRACAIRQRSLELNLVQLLGQGRLQHAWRLACAALRIDFVQLADVVFGRQVTFHLQILLGPRAHHCLGRKLESLCVQLVLDSLLEVVGGLDTAIIFCLRVYQRVLVLNRAVVVRLLLLGGGLDLELTLGGRHMVLYGKTRLALGLQAWYNRNEQRKQFEPIDEPDRCELESKGRKSDCSVDQLKCLHTF